MNNLETTYLSVPLGSEPHGFARQFAAEQITAQKGRQTYLNTLAVYAVHRYLQWLQIETDLSQGDSWNPGLRSLFDVADLCLPGLGKLECRPVPAGATSLTLPAEVTDNRIGYVAVRFNPPLNQAELLGFWAAEAVKDREAIPLADIDPLDTLLDRIPSSAAQAAVPTAISNRVNLSAWLEHVFGAGWQALEDLFSAEAANFAVATRSAGQAADLALDSAGSEISRGKLIDLGLQLSGHRVALIVTLRPQAREEVDIRVQVRPAGDLSYLPLNLQLTVRDESGTCLQAQARSADQCIQLEFSGVFGERFSARVGLGDARITEDFVI